MASNSTKLGNKFLFDYQKKCVQKFKESDKGIIVYHGVGTGKTLTSIKCANLYPNMTPIFVTTASVVNQFTTDVKKYLINKKSFLVLSYEKFVKILDSRNLNLNNNHHMQNNNDFNNILLIVDEAHNLRSNKGRSQKILKFSKNIAKKTLFLTGTVFINSPYDIAHLINALANEKDTHNLGFPSGEDSFQDKFYDYEPSNNPKIKIVRDADNKEYFKYITYQYVHKHTDRDDSDDFPKVIPYDRTIKMHKEQEKLCLAVESKLGISIQNAKNIGAMRPVFQKKLNAFFNKTRALSNVIKGKPHIITPKIKTIHATIVKYQRYPVIVYTNFLSAGIQPFMNYVKNKSPDLSMAYISGKVSQPQRNTIIKRYNEDNEA